MTGVSGSVLNSSKYKLGGNYRIYSVYRDIYIADTQILGFLI